MDLSSEAASADGVDLNEVSHVAARRQTGTQWKESLGTTKTHIEEGVKDGQRPEAARTNRV